MKYINLYRRSIHIGRLPKNGLCNCLKKNREWDSLPEEMELMLPLDNQLTYWGHEWCDKNPYAEIPKHLKRSIHYDLTPLRQNILLFCAAMAVEL